MADKQVAASTAREPHADAHGRGEIHMPPNSWMPIATALALTVLFVGFLVGPVVWIIGSVMLVACLVVWYLAARNEFRELPD